MCLQKIFQKNRQKTAKQKKVAGKKQQENANEINKKRTLHEK